MSRSRKSWVNRVEYVIDRRPDAGIILLEDRLWWRDREISLIMKESNGERWYIGRDAVARIEIQNGSEILIVSVGEADESVDTKDIQVRKYRYKRGRNGLFYEMRLRDS